MRGLQVGDTVKVRRGLLEGLVGQVLQASWPKAKVAVRIDAQWWSVKFRQVDLELVETVEDQVERLR